MRLPRLVARLVITLLVLRADPSRGETGLPLRIVTEERLPFSRRQLLQAVKLRLSVLGAAPAAENKEYRIAVRRSGAEEVTVEFGYKRRTLQLPGQRGGPAARRVALAIVDLVREELELSVPAPPAPAPRAPSAPPARRPASAPSATSPRPPARPRPPSPGRQPPARSPLARPWAVGPLFSVGGGSNWDRPTFSVALDSTLRLWGSFRAVLDAGLALAPGTTAGDVSLRLWGVPLRLGLAWQPTRYRVQVRATATLWPYWLQVGEGASPASTSGAALGGGASAFYQLPLFGPVDALLGVGADVFANRVQFLAHGAPALATERVAFWGGAGFTLGGRP